MSSRFILPFADVGSGIKPSSGAKLFFFETDGVTPKNTFSDQLATPTPNANPVIADSNGVFGDIYIVGQYKVTLEDKNGSQIFGGVIIEETVTGTSQTRTIINYSELNDAINDSTLKSGTSANIKERTAGNGGGAMWDAVLASTVTPNTHNIVQCVGAPTLALVLRTSGSETYLKQYGALPTFAEIANNIILLDAAIANMDSIGGGKVIIESDIEYGYKIGVPSTYPNMKSAVNNIQVIDNGIGNGTEAVGFEDGSQIRNFLHTPNVYDGKSDGNGNITIGDYHPYIGIDNSANLAPADDPSRSANDNYRASVVYKADGIAQWIWGQGVNVGPSFDKEDMLDFRGAINGIPDLTPPINDLVKWFQVSKGTSAVAFNSTTFSKTTPYEFSIRPGFGSGNCIFRGTDVSPHLRLISDDGEVGLRRTSTLAEFRVDNVTTYSCTATGVTHRYISSTGNVDQIFDALSVSRRFTLNNASGDYRWQASNLSTNTMIHTDSGNLTITGAYSPFTGVHPYYSNSELVVGDAVDLVNAEQKIIIINEEDGVDDEGEIITISRPVTTEGRVTTTTTANSKLCAGIVESCDLIEGVYIVAVASVGDNRTSNLKGFKTNNSNGEIEAGDILVTSAVTGELMLADSGLPESVVRFKAMSAPDNDGIVYGYFK